MTVTNDRLFICHKTNNMSLQATQWRGNPHVIQSRRRRISNKPVIAVHVIQRAKPEESLASLVRNLSLSLNMTSHSVLDTESVNTNTLLT